MTKSRFSIAIGMALFVACFGLSALEKEESAHPGHRFGKWPAISAMIHHEFQKNLDLDGKDFLIETWFTPLPVSSHKGKASNVLISKKCSKNIPGYSLSYSGSRLFFRTCDKSMELEKEQTFVVNAKLSIGSPCYLAIAFSREKKTLTFYKNGEILRVYKDAKLGDMSNKNPFNIGYYENHGNTSPHCDMTETRIWKFKNSLPNNIDTIVKNDNSDPAKPAEALLENADYSIWKFTPSNEDVIDQGNNGNTLCYVPFGYKDKVKIIPFPETPTGKTYYVDNTNPQATDEGEGTKEKPFKTIKRGVKATYPGDLLHICAGTYREGISPRAGENGKPITIEGEEGTVILGSTPLQGWRKKSEEIWEIVNWTGKYEPPSAPKEADARSDAGNLIFINEEPMDFVKTRQELVPGTWTAEPIMGRGPKRILLRPLPGIDPTQAKVEITETGLAGAGAKKFTHIRNLRFLHCGVGLGGVGNILENCSIEWVAFRCLSIRGQDQIVRNNKFLWAGNSALGGSSIRLIFENNLLSYNGWRYYGQGWHGGAIKLVPGNMDHIMRNNTLRYNDIATIWYDAWNMGNLIEGNICHDNSGHGGIFDEISFGNTFNYNICYNNYGQGICIGESSEETIYRNIIFNNYGAGITFRSNGKGSAENPAKLWKSLWEKYSDKLDVRRYQGYIEYDKEKALRRMIEEYWCRYPVRSYGKKCKIIENVLFDNNALEVGNPINYEKDSGVPRDILNTFQDNIYWDRSSDKIISNRRKSLNLKTWQKVSGQDQNSKFMNPYENMDKMPEWFRERFKFKQDEFRPIGKVFNGYLSNLRKSTSRTVLMSRLLRSKKLEKITFTDPTLFGIYFEMDGEKCASLWSKGVGLRNFIVPEKDKLVYESKYLMRKAMTIEDSRLSVLVGDDPITLIGIGDKILADRTVVLEVPMWTEPGKAIPAKLTLENVSSTDYNYNLTASVADAWKIKNNIINKTVPAGERITIDIPILPPAEVRKGIFQINVSGNVNDRKLSLSKNFAIGSLLVLKRIGNKLEIDGSLKDWGKLGIPNGIAEAKEQVVFGEKNWQGPDDLSAKVWLRWNESRELYLAIEVTDDKFVAGNSNKDTCPDSIQVMVDVRAEWKHYMKEYTAGAFNLTLKPGDEKNPATATYGRLRFGTIRGVAFRKTDKGYIVELDIHFHTAQVDDPGWVAKRPIRVGVLINDSDDPNGKEKKSTIGVWRTADDASENCASLTTFITEK